MCMRGDIQQAIKRENAYSTGFPDRHILKHEKNRREVADCYPENTNGGITAWKKILGYFQSHIYKITFIYLPQCL